MYAIDTKLWTHNATLLLISLTKQMAEDFQSPVLKKVEVWKKVAAQMLAKGYGGAHRRSGFSLSRQNGVFVFFVL